MHGPGHPAGLFFRKLALMIGSGVPLIEAIEAIAQGIGCGREPGFGPRAEMANRMRAVLERVVEDVKRTGKFATALEAHPDLFPPEVVAIVRSGESAGQLDTALMKVAGAVQDGTLGVGRRRFGLPGFLRERFGLHAAWREGPPHDHRPPPPPPHPPPPPPPHDHHHHHAPPPPPPGLVSVTELLRAAVRARASDVHIEPLADGGRVRFRVDGRLREHVRLDATGYTRLVQDVKGFSFMDHAETRLPQEARQSLEVDGRSVQFRFATSPYVYGEAITARLLAPPDKASGLTDLGFSGPQLETLRRWLARPYGIIAATGPTGSGKTTTVMALMAGYDAAALKVMSVEQPVEILLDGVNQLSLRPELGLSWETALRAQLKHDPDVVMIGEVPSPEVARLILQVALSGHVVLTCLHADSVDAFFARLAAIGLEPALLAQALTGVIAQRLVRRLCEQCRERLDAPVVPAGAEHALTDLPAGTYYRARGCTACHGSGYNGRIAVYELADPATAGRHRPLIRDAIDRTSQGLTTLEEVVRVCLF